MSEAYGQPLPQEPSAERAALGAILINPKSFSRLRPMIDADDFVDGKHRKIWNAMMIVADGTGDVDPIAVLSCLSGRGELELAGGVAYFAGLTDTIPDIARVELYAQMLREKSALRRIVKASHKATQDAILGGSTSQEIVAELDAALAGVGQVNGASRPLVDIATEVVHRAECRPKGQLLGLRTAFRQLNALTEGLMRGALMIIAAPSSHGKTAFGLQLIEDAVTLNPEARAVVYEAEMSDEAIINRMISRNCKIELSQIRRWNLDFIEQEIVQTYLLALGGVRDRLHASTSIGSISALIADAKQRKVDGGLDLVLVDYLQLIDPRQSAERRDLEVSAIGKELVALAKQLNCAVIALSQVTATGAARLTQDSLRESRALAHHARSVLLLSRPRQADKGNENIPWCAATLQVEKQSEGPVGDIVMHWNGRLQTFDEGECPTGCPGLRRAEAY